MRGFDRMRSRLPRRGIPRLVPRFLAVVSLGLVLAGIAIFAVVERTLARQAERQAVDHAQVTTTALLDRQLTGADLTRRLSATRRRHLAALLAPANLGSHSLGATLYGSHGAILSTAEPALAAPAESLVTRARGGIVTSTVASVASHRVLRTVLPIRVGAKDVGAVELDQDYGAIAATARRTALVAGAILEALLVLLCALLLPTLARATGRLRRQVNELDWLTSHDELTELLNRRGFTRRVEEELGRPAAHGALLLVDLDRFHEVNETIGADQGDVLLVDVGRQLSTIFEGRPLARLGADEYAVLLPEAQETEIGAAARAVFAAFADTIAVNGIRIGVNVRIGGVRYPEHAADAETMIRRASIALTCAKEENRRLAFYNDERERRDTAALTMIGELRTAFVEGQLRVHYQPQADVATGAVRGVEALVRWQHPQRGLLVAGEFVGAIEQTDLIHKLSRFVLAEATQQWRRWCDQGLKIDVAVNLSTIDVVDLSLPRTIIDLLIAQRMPPDRLVLEITETALLRDEERANEVLQQLDQAGIRLSIDDFGTGYSSLSMLRKLPIRQVKIDHSFVAGIPEDRENDSIVQSTIQLAHTLGAVVVAEGVETAGQLRRLTALNCDCAQGFLIGRPASAADLALDRLAAPIVLGGMAFDSAARPSPVPAVAHTAGMATW